MVARVKTEKEIIFIIIVTTIKKQNFDCEISVFFKIKNYLLLKIKNNEF